MRGRRGRSGAEVGGEGDQSEQAVNAKDSTEQSAKQDADVTISEKTSATAEKEDASEEEAQIERVMPDADSEAEQRLDQPTA